MSRSDFGVEVEEGVEASFELGFDLLARALDGVHGDVGLMAVGELEGRVLNFSDLALGEQTESVDESEIRHR